MPVSFVMATILLYLAGTVCFLVYLLRRSEALSTVSLWLTAAGFTTHTIALNPASATNGAPRPSAPASTSARRARSGRGPIPRA